MKQGPQGLRPGGLMLLLLPLTPALSPKGRGGMFLLLVHAAHAATAAGHRGGLLVFLDVGHQALGGDHQAGNRSSVLQRGAGQQSSPANR